MLAELLHKIAGQKYQEKEGNKKYYPRPSLAGPERCIRQMVYWRLNTPAKPLPGRGALVFDDSSWHEELTADWIRQSAYKLHSEQMKVKAEMDGFSFALSGSIDGILEDISGKEFLWEHKAISHFSWQEIAKGQPRLDNLTQSAIYLRGLHAVSPNITDLILLYKNKNTAQYVEFLGHYDYDTDTLNITSMHSSVEGMEETPLDLTYPDIVRNAFEKFQDVENFATENKIPPRQYDRDHWRCEYCQYNQVCWENYEQEFQALGTDEELPELEDLCGYYLETSMHLREMKKENDELKAKIKEVLKAKGIREGKTKRYIIKNALVKSVRIDKELIPLPVLAVCQKESFSERLTINLKKEAKNGKSEIHKH